MRRRFFLIFNKAAGTSRRTAVEHVVTALETAGASVVWSTATTPTAARHEAADAARSGAYDAVIAAGGDGTIRQAAAALASTSCPLGAIMLGTGNVLAHELALPRDAPALAAMLLHGPTLDVDLGLANGEPFLLMAGAGFDGRVMAGLDQRLKQRIAKAAFVPPVLRTLRLPLDQLDVRLDGVPFTATWAIVTSARHYGGAFVLQPATSLREPGLQAVLFHAHSKPRLLSQLMSLALGRLDRRAAKPDADITIRACEEAIITARHAVPAQIDGDDFGTTPLTVRRGGGQVRLIIPGHLNT